MRGNLTYSKTERNNNETKGLTSWKSFVDSFSQTLFFGGVTQKSEIRLCSQAGSLQTYALTPTIDNPTRVHRGSATLIDNIVINQFWGQLSSGNIISDISDFKLTKSFRHSKYRDFTHFSEDNVNDVGKSFSSFFSKTNKVVNKHIPLKNTSRQKAKLLLKPWIITGILKSIRSKNHFFSSGENQKYKMYRNKISTLTRISKKKYFSNFFMLNLNNTRKFWEEINGLISDIRSKRKRTISSIRCPNSKRVYKDPAKGL